MKPILAVSHSVKKNARTHFLSLYGQIEPSKCSTFIDLSGQSPYYADPNIPLRVLI